MTMISTLIILVFTKYLLILPASNWIRLTKPIPPHTTHTTTIPTTGPTAVSMAMLV